MSDEERGRGIQTRRRFLGLAAGAGILGTAGCSSGEPSETPPPTRSPTRSPTPTPTEASGQRAGGSYSLAEEVDYWAWYPEDPALWSRSEAPYDFEHDGGRWLAEPMDDGSIRCRVENDSPPGNAGFYFDFGFIDEIGSVTIKSETVRSDSDSAQTLLAAMYLDVTGDGTYFEWEADEGRERFVGLGGDAELLRTFPAGGEFTIDHDTALDLVPPADETLVTIGELVHGEIAGIPPVRPAAIQISAVGGGEGNTEETVVYDVDVEHANPPPARSWPMFSHDTLNTGHIDASTGPTTGVEARWSFETDGAVRSSPAVVRDTVYVGSDDGHVYGLNAETAEERWSFRTEGAVESSPAVLGGLVCVGSHDHHVYALTAGTGESVWSFETGDKVRSSPTVAANADTSVIDNIVAIGSDDGRLYALDARAGEPTKAISTGGPVVATPTILVSTGGVWELTCGSTDGSVYYWVPDYQNGHVSSRETEAPVNAQVSLPDQRTENIWYQPTDAGRLYKFVNYENTPAWTFETGGKIRTTPVLAGDFVYIGSRDGNVYGIDVESGESKWTFETGGKVDSSPAVADGTLYVGSADHHVYALDAVTGEEVWSFETGGEVVSSPAVVEGTVYVGSNDGSVYALTGPAD